MQLVEKCTWSTLTSRKVQLSKSTRRKICRLMVDAVNLTLHFFIMPFVILFQLYRRMKNLEGVDSNLIIIDIVSPSTVKRIINVYRSFNPQNNVNARMKFKYQLNLIKNLIWLNNSFSTYKIKCKKLFLSF